MGLKDRFLRWLAPRLGWGYLKFVGVTSRVDWHGMEHVRALDGGAFVYAFWHGRQAIFPYTHRGEGSAVMVSRSKDGEIIAEVMRLAGLRAVRGSSSRGGVAALKELIDVAKTGVRVGFTPDGPRGPIRQVQPGALWLAREAQIPILPLAAGLKRKLVFRNWDEFFFPLPFNRIAVVYGPPISVGAGDDMEKKAEELRLALNAVTAEADRLAEA